MLPIPDDVRTLEEIVSHRLRRIAVPAALALVGAFVPLASAANAGGVVASSTTTTEMGIVQPIRLVAAPNAAGVAQVLMDNGATISVPAADVARVLNPTPPPSQAAKGGATPNAIVFGDCGYSTINVGYKSNGLPVRMTTGFHVNDAATDYQWTAVITGPSYSYNYNASGGLALRHDWNGSHNSSLNYPTGWYTATVSPAGSFAILYWGGVCFSGGPSQTTYL